MAIMGYIMYGEGVNSQVTLNLPVGKLSSKIAIYTTLINPLTKYALLLTAISNSIEKQFQLSEPRFISILIRIVLVIGTVDRSSTVPFFRDLVTLTSSFLISTATMLLPCICYIFRNTLHWGLELVILIAIMAVGASIAVIGPTLN